MRTDPSIRLPEDKTREEISKLLPKEIIVSAVFCDEATGEVVLEVNKPEVIDAEMVIKNCSVHRLDFPHKTLSSHSINQHK